MSACFVHTFGCCSHLQTGITQLNSTTAKQHHKRVTTPFLLTEPFACLAVRGSRHAVPKTRVREVMQQGVPEAAPVPAARRVAATSARPLLRSLPSTAISCLTRKYFPLPHPTSATKDPGASLSMNCLTCNASSSNEALQHNSVCFSCNRCSYIAETDAMLSGTHMPVMRSIADRHGASDSTLQQASLVDQGIAKLTKCMHQSSWLHHTTWQVSDENLGPDCEAS